MSTVTTDLIEAKKISWNNIIQDCTLSIASNSFTVIVGRNGSGKSSLLRCLSGWYKTDSGTVKLNGRSVNQISPKERAASIGLLPQRISVSENLPIKEWLSHFRFRFSEPKKITQRHIATALSKHQLEQLTDRTWPQLSGGEAQRMALLGLTLQETECWLLDEPGNHLDPSVAHQLYQELVSEWQNGTTIVLVTHNINVLFQHLSKELWDSVKVVGMNEGTVKWKIAMSDESLPTHLGELYGLHGQYIDLGTTKQIFYLVNKS